MIDTAFLNLSTGVLEAYAFTLMIAFACTWKLRSMRAEISQLTAQSLEDMKNMQKQFDDAVIKLREQYDHDLKMLQEAKGVVWLRVGAAADETCPNCGWKQEPGKLPSSLAN